MASTFGLPRAWTEGSSMEAFNDEFISFGVHDFINKKLISDFVLILLRNVWQYLSLDPTAIQVETS